MRRKIFWFIILNICFCFGQRRHQARVLESGSRRSGDCETCCDCPEEEETQICASNNQIYKNKCYFECAQKYWSKQGTTITDTNDSECAAKLATGQKLDGNSSGTGTGTENPGIAPPVTTLIVDQPEEIAEAPKDLLSTIKSSSAPGDDAAAPVLRVMETEEAPNNTSTLPVPESVPVPQRRAGQLRLSTIESSSTPGDEAAAPVLRFMETGEAPKNISTLPVPVVVLQRRAGQLRLSTTESNSTPGDEATAPVLRSETEEAPKNTSTIPVPVSEPVPQRRAGQISYMNPMMAVQNWGAMYDTPEERFGFQGGWQMEQEVPAQVQPRKQKPNVPQKVAPQNNVPQARINPQFDDEAMDNGEGLVPGQVQPRKQKANFPQRTQVKKVAPQQNVPQARINPQFDDAAPQMDNYQQEVPTQVQPRKQKGNVPQRTQVKKVAPQQNVPQARINPQFDDDNYQQEVPTQVQPRKQKANVPQRTQAKKVAPQQNVPQARINPQFDDGVPQKQNFPLASKRTQPQGNQRKTPQAQRPNNNQPQKRIQGQGQKQGQGQGHGQGHGHGQFVDEQHQVPQKRIQYDPDYDDDTANQKRGQQKNVPQKRIGQQGTKQNFPIKADNVPQKRYNDYEEPPEPKHQNQGQNFPLKKPGVQKRINNNQHQKDPGFPLAARQGQGDAPQKRNQGHQKDPGFLLAPRQGQGDAPKKRNQGQKDPGFPLAARQGHGDAPQKRHQGQKDPGFPLAARQGSGDATKHSNPPQKRIQGSQKKQQKAPNYPIVHPEMLRRQNSEVTQKTIIEGKQGPRAQQGQGRGGQQRRQNPGGLQRRSLGTTELPETHSP